MDGETIWRGLILLLVLVEGAYCNLLARRVARLEEQVRQLGGGSPAPPSK